MELDVLEPQHVRVVKHANEDSGSKDSDTEQLLQVIKTPWNRPSLHPKIV